MNPIKIGDHVIRIGPDGDSRLVGEVIAIAERPSRTTTTGQAVSVETRIQVQWPAVYSHRKPVRTWLAVSGEGTRWIRIAGGAPAAGGVSDGGCHG